MPNDPRVKFHKGGKICRKDLEYLKKHPECYGFITDGGLRRDGGSGAGGGGAVRPPDPDPGGGSVPWTPLNPSIPVDPPYNPPDPVPKPGLTPGEIAGITIASAAAAAALAAAAERERQRRARAIPVPQDDIEMTGTRRGRFSLNRGGTEVPSQSRTLPKGISKAINAGFVSVDSSPASSVSSSRSSSASSSPSVSGTSTPARRGLGVPTPFEQAGYTSGIDLLNPRPASKPPLIAPDRMINPNAQGTAAEQLKELTRLQAAQGGAPPQLTRQTSLGTQVIDTQNEMDISVRMLQMEAAGATEAEKIAEAQRMRAEYNEYLNELDASTADLDRLMELEFKLENPLTLKSEVAELKRQYKALTGNDFQSAREQSRASGISRAINTPMPEGPVPTRNTPITDALNASQPTAQPHSDPAARATTLASTADTITADLPAGTTRLLGSIQEDMVDINLDVTPMRESRFERVRRMFDRSRARVEPTDSSSRGLLERGRPSRTSAISQQELSGLDAAVRATRRVPIRLRDFLADLGLSELMPLLQTEGFDSVHAIGNYDINEANEMREALMERGVPESDINRILEAAKGAPFGAETEPRPTYQDRGLQPPQPAASEREAAGVGIDFSAEPARPAPAPAPAPADLIDLGERPAQPAPRPPTPPKPRTRPPPEDFGEEMENLRERPMPAPERPARPAPEPMGEELGSLSAQNHIANFNEWYDSFMTRDLYAQGFVDPEVPPDIMAQGKLAEKKYILDEAIKFVTEEGRHGIQEQKVVRGERVETGRKIPRAKMLKSVEKFYNKAIAQQASLPQPSASAATSETRAATARERLSQRSQEIRTGQQDLNRLVETQRASTRPAAAAPELTSRAARAAPRPPTPPKPRPPAGSAPPSAPGSAPGSETATPRERALMEQTPAERAAFAEELTGRLKKGPSRQKAKINIGKTTKGTPNPLDIFVNPQFHNAPNMELNPRAAKFRGTLTEISARVPRLVPSRTTLINMGAEGGSMVGGFAAGYFSAQAMNDYFAKHPAKNLGEQYGQALATSFVGMAVGSLTQQVLSAVIRQGVNYALTGEVAALAGFTSGAGTAFLTSIGEAALFTAVGVTTQMLTTKFLEDAGYNHAISRSVGAAVSTYALAETEYYLWAAKSAGGLNLAADASLIVSEAMIIGFGIYQTITEYIEGAKQDEEEEEYQAQLAENKRLNEERDRVIDTTLRRNNARQAFMIAYEAADYDFDKALAAMTPQQRIDLGQSADTTDPNSLVAFRAQIEAAFDPLLDTSTSEGYKPDPRPLSREEQLKKDTYNAYITWYIDSLSGKNPPPFDVNSEGAQLLSRETGGTWMSAANVHAQTSITMARRTNPLIQNAQEEIVNAFHKEHKTIEEMPPDIVQYADLDPGFRGRYNAYIIAEAQTQIYMEYNTAGITYNDMDPKLVAIANRDAEFRSAVDTYYQVIANQMRDYNLTIQEAVHLNALAANGEQTEIGKLNEARTKIIQQHQAANQEQVDRYNASILQEISAYGDNFEAIIRNINDQALLTGHTFLYAATPADLYRQLHMEMPELELVDPDTDGPDAPLPGPSKGRKIGDTALYGYRYKLTDEQNQELDEQARIGVFADNETQMAAAAAIIYERDRYLFEETDAEKAARENLTLDEYYEKYGIPVEQPIIEWDRSKGNPKEDGKYRFPDGTIETWKNGFRVKVDTTNKVAPPAITKYDPTLSSQPDGQIEMPDGAVRTYKDGLVTSVKYPSGTKATEMLTPDEINAKERPPTTPTTPTEPTGTITYEQLQQQYPETYKNLLRKYGDDPTGPAQIEATLRKAYNAGFNETTGETSTGLTPGGQPVEPITREPTYEELKVMYPDKYTLFSSTYKSMHSQASQEIIDKQTELYLRQQYSKNPVPLPPPQPVTPTEPKQRVLFSGDRKMPDGSTRVYVNGKVIGISYPAGFPANQMMKADKASLTRLNDQEGLYYVEVEPTPVTPTQPTDPTTLKQGSVTMPDGSRRTYKNGLVIEVYYPPNMADLGNKNPTQINDAEGIRNSTWIPEAPVVTPVEPVVDRDTLLQGRVTWSDRSTRTYIDGKVVSVQYPDGKTGPNINEINAAEGVQLAKDPGARPKDWMDRFLEEQAQQQKAKNDADAAAAAAAAAENPEPDIYVNPGANPRYIASKQTPAPANTTAQALNLAVAPARAPATTSMPEDTTPGVANP